MFDQDAICFIYDIVRDEEQHFDFIFFIQGKKHYGNHAVIFSKCCMDDILIEDIKDAPRGKPFKIDNETARVIWI